MEVKVVMWREIPKGFHFDILRDVSVGEYVDSLPYRTDDFLSYKIPIPNRTVIDRMDSCSTIDFRYIEFRKQKVLPLSIRNSAYVWERIY